MAAIRAARLPRLDLLAEWSTKGSLLTVTIALDGGVGGLAKAKAALFEGVAAMFGNQMKGVRALGSGVGSE